MQQLYEMGMLVKNSGTRARILVVLGIKGAKTHRSRAVSRAVVARPNRWKEIYSSRAPAAGLKYGVDVETPRCRRRRVLGVTPHRVALPGSTVELHRILSRRCRYAGIGLEFRETRRRAFFRRPTPGRAGLS